MRIVIFNFLILRITCVVPCIHRFTEIALCFVDALCGGIWHKYRCCNNQCSDKAHSTGHFFHCTHNTPPKE